MIPNHNLKNIHLGNRKIWVKSQVNHLVGLILSKDNSITLEMTILKWGRLRKLSNPLFHFHSRVLQMLKNLFPSCAQSYINKTLPGSSWESFISLILEEDITGCPCSPLFLPWTWIQYLGKSSHILSQR